MGTYRKAKNIRLAYIEMLCMLKAENRPLLFMKKDIKKNIRPVVKIDNSIDLKMCFFL